MIQKWNISDESSIGHSAALSTLSFFSLQSVLRLVAQLLVSCMGDTVRSRHFWCIEAEAYILRFQLLLPKQGRGGGVSEMGLGDYGTNSGHMLP